MRTHHGASVVIKEITRLLADAPWCVPTICWLTESCGLLINSEKNAETALTRFNVGGGKFSHFSYAIVKNFK